MNSIYKQVIKRTLSIGIFIVFMILSYYFFDLTELWTMSEKLWSRPDILILVVFVYFLSFCLKAWSWKLYLHKKPRFLSCLLGILYSLFVNHIFPIKVGDLVRAGVLSAKEKEVMIEESLHSVVVLRLLDILSLMLFAMVGIFAMDIAFTVPLWLLLTAVIGGGIMFILLKRTYPAFIARQLTLMNSAFSGANGLLIFLLTLTSWVFEAAVLFGTAIAVNKEVSFVHSIWTNSLTVAGQVFQITPGGIANYETIMTFALGMVGLSMKEGYMIAIITHSIKFVFSYIVGAIVFYIFPVSRQVLKIWIKQKGVLRG